ncbi:hypothetical protein BH23ACI1_BH23ACI1_28830 [soil metagenome]|nr:MgtC/SapB family protein [Acidobacteriota bacterium]
MTRRVLLIPIVLLWALVVLASHAAPAAAQPATDVVQPQQGQAQPVEAFDGFWDELRAAVIKLPLAALLGAALALRPRRRGTPKRQTAVIQTQIILAVVGAVIILIVGASLARAFGIVGAANLIRYRSKIDDPKDAVVMLSALAVGLASGAGLYALGIFSTVFLVGALWVIESFEPEVRKRFEVTVKAGDDTDALRPRVERILDRFGLLFELRTSSDEQLCYDVQVPLDVQVKDISDALLRLDPAGHAAVEWSEKKANPK